MVTTKRNEAATLSIRGGAERRPLHAVVSWPISGSHVSLTPTIPADAIQGRAG